MDEIVGVEHQWPSRTRPNRLWQGHLEPPDQRVFFAMRDVNRCTKEIIVVKVKFSFDLL